MRKSDAVGSARRFRELSEEQLTAVVQEGFAWLGIVELRAIFANPFLDEGATRQILARPGHLENQEVRKALAAHRCTPLVDALRLVATLGWADVVEVGRQARVRAPVRRAAHQALVERYDGLAVGERISLGHRAGADLLSRVRHDPEPRVIRAMLENPRLNEGTLMPLLSSGSVRPEVLRSIASNERWNSRYAVRCLLCRNAKTPPDIVLGLLPTLKKSDLRAIESHRGLPERVRAHAALLLGKGR